MLRVFLIGVSITLSALAWAAPTMPERVEINDEEKSRALGGEVVVKQDESHGNLLTAAVFVSASPEAVMKAVMDLPPRLDEIDNLEGLEIYEAGGHVAARWKLDAKLKIAFFSVIYECDWTRHFCSFGLDPTKKSDIPQADGAYRAIAHEGGSWLEYYSLTQPPAMVPAAVRRARREASTQQMLLGMKRRAEAGP